MQTCVTLCRAQTRSFLIWKCRNMTALAPRHIGFFCGFLLHESAAHSGKRGIPAQASNCCPRCLFIPRKKQSSERTQQHQTLPFFQLGTAINFGWAVERKGKLASVSHDKQHRSAVIPHPTKRKRSFERTLLANFITFCWNLIVFYSHKIVLHQKVILAVWSHEESAEM